MSVSNRRNINRGAEGITANKSRQTLLVCFLGETNAVYDGDPSQIPDRPGIHLFGEFLVQELSELDKLTLKARLLAASGLDVNSFRERVFQEFHPSILLPGFMDRLDEVAFCRARILGFKSFPGDLFQATF